MRLLLSALFSLLVLPAAFAENQSSSAPKAQTAAPSESSWISSLLPKPFQKNPSLEMTVITEVSEEGKNSRRFRRINRLITCPKPAVTWRWATSGPARKR